MRRIALIHSRGTTRIDKCFDPILSLLFVARGQAVGRAGRDQHEFELSILLLRLIVHELRLYAHIVQCDATERLSIEWSTEIVETGSSEDEPSRFPALHLVHE